MTHEIGEPVDIVDALDWVKLSLARGQRLASLVLARAERFQRAALLVPQGSVDLDDLVLSDNGRAISRMSSMVLLETFLARLADDGMSTVAVELTLNRPGDPHLPPAVGHVGDDLIAWVDLETEGARTASELLAGAGVGHPENAFVSPLTPTALGLRTGELSPRNLEEVASTTAAVIVSVFDDEGFVVVT